jgi:uncharacterized membrane protein (UPF0182 family)
VSVFGLDPEQLFRRRPRVVRERKPPSRRRRITVGILVVAVVLLLASSSLMRLRVDYLFLGTLGHSNVFWTPLVTQVVLFLIGFAVTALLIGVSVPFWSRAVSGLDARAGRITRWVGVALAVVAGIAGGSSLAGSWQDVLLFLHGGTFGATDPVFGQDYAFYVFTLPVIDAVSALLWGVVIVSALASVVIAAFAAVVISAPSEIDFPLEPAEGRTPDHAQRLAIVHAGVLLVAVFVLAALGAHFGAYHLATSDHVSQYSFTGPDATERNVTRPILGFLQVLALVLAVLVAVILAMRRGRGGRGTGSVLGAILGGWLLLAGILQSVPGAVYQGTSVSPNALSAQTPSINDYLTTSRYAWGLQNSKDNVAAPQVVDEQFGTVGAPTFTDLAADPGTLRNIRVQDHRELPDTLEQIDRSRAYQTYPTITVDRYAGADGVETQVMLGPREISEDNLPQQNFVSKSLIYTHGYGITAVSVNQVAAEGKPDILAGHQPLTQVSPAAPPALTFDGHAAGDPRLYCGDKTSQPVVVNTTQSEFDYPVSGNTDSFTRAGPNMAGFAIDNPLDKLSASLTSFSGFDLFLTNAVTGDSRVLMHREIQDRVQTLAPFLTVDKDPYLVADPDTNHLMWIADAYVTSDRFPESFKLSEQDSGISNIPNDVSYARNTVKAVVDARTCAITLYATDLKEPITAAWNGIYPGLLTPLSEMPSFLRQHLRYPEDLFSAQVKAYASVHVTDPAVFFNKNDLYRPSDEIVTEQNGSTSTATTHPYYVEMTLPGSDKTEFVLFQTFSPGSNGSGGQANNMTAWLAAQSDYTSTSQPKLVAVPLNNSANVLGPYQFDNNVNTNPDISKEITLLSQRGSTVILGNVLVLPFNNNSFLYVRPFYVLANSGGNGSFPQLIHVIVGTQNAVAMGDNLVDALQNLYKTKQPFPGLATPTPGPASPTPSPSGKPTPTPSPAAGITLTPQEVAILNDLLQHQAAAEADYAKGDYAAAGAEQQKVKQDSDQLRQLLGQGSASPSPAP